MTAKKFSTPKGYESLNQTEDHIANIGQGFYKRNDAGDLIMAFWAQKAIIKSPASFLL